MHAQTQPESQEAAQAIPSSETVRAVWGEVLRAAWTVQSFRSALHEASAPGARVPEALERAMAHIAKDATDRAQLELVENELRRAQTELSGHQELMEDGLAAIESALRTLWELRKKASR